jgi:hypothetical protein
MAVRYKSGSRLERGKEARGVKYLCFEFGDKGDDDLGVLAPISQSLEVRPVDVVDSDGKGKERDICDERAARLRRALGFFLCRCSL